MLCANLDHSLLLLRRKWAYRKRNGKNLVGAQRSIVADAGRVNHVVAAVSLGIPKFLKTLFRFVSKFFVAVERFNEQAAKIGHRLERIDPKRINLYGFSRARSHDPIANF